MAGATSGANCAKYFCTTDFNSANYCVGIDGDISCNVIEEYGAWTSANHVNDEKAITVEVSDKDENYDCSTEASMNALYDLLADIVSRYPSLGGKLVYTGDDKGNLNYHAMVSNHPTGCPGEWMIERMPLIVKEVNKRLGVK